MRLSPMFVIGAGLVLLWCLIAAAAPLLATHDPYAIDFEAILQAPNAAHWFGTDNVGRDIYSRVVYGARLALYIGLLGVIAPMVIGMAIGLLAGYFGGWVDALAMR
ncbi:ABC transporter permease, partial [Cribrihabitans sp. XS_ASV171]